MGFAFSREIVAMLGFSRVRESMPGRMIHSARDHLCIERFEPELKRSFCK